MHGLAAASLGDIVAALARITAIVVVRFAVGNHTLIVLELKRFEAFEANMISLLYLASQHQIVFAISEDQRVLVLAFDALFLSIILLAVFDSFLAETIHSDETVGTI